MNAITSLGLCRSSSASTSRSPSSPAQPCSWSGPCWGSGACCVPARPQPQKYLNYECGVDPVGVGWSQSQIRYYVFALLFVMFDVEAVFIFPWAVRLEALQVFGLVEMIIFIAILALGLLYAWRKRVLRWV